MTSREVAEAVGTEGTESLERKRERLGRGPAGGGSREREPRDRGGGPAAPTGAPPVWRRTPPLRDMRFWSPLERSRRCDERGRVANGRLAGRSRSGQRDACTRPAIPSC